MSAKNLFSPKYSTFTAWKQAQKPNSSYAKEIERLHRIHPNATLSQLRRHPGETRKPLSQLKKKNGRLSWETMTNRERERYDRVIEAIHLMRTKNMSLTEASKQTRASPESIRKMAGSALNHQGRRWGAKPSDRLERRMIFYDLHGQFPIIVNTSKQASLIGRYHAALRIYFEHGDDSALKIFQGKSIKTKDGQIFPFMTDTNVLNRLARSGQMRFESIYSITGG